MRTNESKRRALQAWKDFVQAVDLGYTTNILGIAAKELGVNYTKVNQLLKEGLLKGIKKKKHWRIYVDSIEKFKRNPKIKKRLSHNLHERRNCNWLKHES